MRKKPNYQGDLTRIESKNKTELVPPVPGGFAFNRLV